MSIKMEDEIKSWTAKRKSALTLDITRDNITVSEAGRSVQNETHIGTTWLSPEQTRQNLQKNKNCRTIHRHHR